MSTNETYLCCWSGVDEKGVPCALFELSNVYRFRYGHSAFAGVIRGDACVTAYCDHIHGDGVLTNDELRLVAACYLDGNYGTLPHLGIPEK